MLSRLFITNYALIDQLEINFESGLNILTGETGSGKSIMLGAIGLILGDRADTKVIEENKLKCVVEGVFTGLNSDFQSFFEDRELDFDTSVCLRREITANGKSRAFINDTPVNLADLRELGMRLIDIHSQHQTLQINDSRFQLAMLDQYADTEKLLEGYREAFKIYRLAEIKLNKLEEQLREAARESEFIEFQLSEFKGLDLELIDEKVMEEEFQSLANAEEIRGVLEQNLFLLQEGDQPILIGIKQIRDQINRLSAYGSSYREWNSRLDALYIELADISREIQSQADKVELDPSRMAALDEIRSKIFRLEQKYQTKGLDALKTIHHELKEKSSSFANIDEAISTAKMELQKSHNSVLELGATLSHKRKSAMSGFQKTILSVLQLLNMKQARVETEIEAISPPNIDGLDQFTLLFSANPGHSVAPLRQVASGGELSRLMLAIKKASANRFTDRTIIFDEIDSGVSGEVAHAMGEIMAEMSIGLQLISITHLPQIASKGRSHFKVHKQVEAGKTYTRIDRLDAEGRVLEIAQMLSGAKTSEAALANARELLQPI